MIRNDKVIQSIRGMNDCLPEKTIMWRYVEDKLKTILIGYGYNEIRFPIVEYTNLFKRSIGEITDVIEKEMYSFDDRNGNNITLRPEGTSGCVRSGIENSLFYNNQDCRLWYCGPMFRYERPQKGRYRQFHQFSAEVFGQFGPDIDAELILITARCWKELGIIENLSLELNSIGLLSSRMSYRKELINFLEQHVDVLDRDDIRRIYHNPMRILDTKNDRIKILLRDAPVLIDYLDENSRSHFLQLCELLDLFGISYIINPYLVRGLDYYNGTVFEWVTDKLGSKKTVCGGGRYDNLVEQLGGGSTPAIGFSIGLERVILLMDSSNISYSNQSLYIDIYFISTGNKTQIKAMLLAEYIRLKLPNLRLMVNCGNANLSKKFMQAIKNKARFVLIMNEQNFLEKTAILKKLHSGEQEVLKYDEIFTKLKNII